MGFLAPSGLLEQLAARVGRFSSDICANSEGHDEWVTA